MNIIIPLGGQGIRFQSAGFKETKPCIPVFHKPMLQYILDSIDTVKNNVFIFYYQNSVLDTFQHSNKNVIFIKIEKQTSGPVETILLGLDLLDEKNIIKKNEKVIFMDCDTLYLDSLLDIFDKEKEKNMVFYRHDTNPQSLYSYINFKNDNKHIDKIKEKEKISDFANTGCYAFQNIQEVHEMAKFIMDNGITAKNGEPYISCIIDQMLNKESDSFVGYELENDRVFSLGTPLELSKYKQSRRLFLFDLDGTLVNTDDLYLKVWQELFQQLNLQIMVTRELYDTIIRGNDDLYVMQMLSIPLHFKEIISEKKDLLFESFVDSIKVIPQAVEFIQYIVQEKGHFASIVTNCNRKTAELLIQKIGLESFIDFIIIGSECPRSKPFPDPYKIAMEKYKDFVTKNQVIIFEDSKSGLLSASSVNPMCLVALETIYDHETLQHYGANVIIEDFSDKEKLFNTVLNFKKDDSTNVLELLPRWIRQSVSFADEINSITVGENKLKGGYISNILAVDIELKSSSILHCVIKLENETETNLSQMAMQLELYDLEYYFYNSIRNYINVKAPKCYGIVKNDKLENVGILLENLYKTQSCTPNLSLIKEPISTTCKIIDELAKFHAKFWNLNLKTIFPDLLTLKKKFSRAKFVREKWPEFQLKWKFLLANNTQKLNQIVNSFEEIETRLYSSKNYTLIHGDVKSPNIFYCNDQTRSPIFLDWQYVSIGKGVQDVVFLILESFDIHTVSYMLPFIQHYYYIQLKQNGIQNYNYENEFLKDWHDAMSYFPFFVCMWFGTVPTDELIDKNFPFFLIQKYLHVLSSRV